MEWSEVARYWNHVKDGVSPSAERAADRMADTLQEGIRRQLSRYPHPAHTYTPSPAGMSPGLISGHLRDRVLTTPARPIGDAIWQTTVGPRDVVYAAIQEYGGEMHAHRQYMTWVTNDKRYYAKDVTLPARPYMHPAVYRMRSDGSITRAARDGFAEVIYGFEGI